MSDGRGLHESLSEAEPVLLRIRSKPASDAIRMGRGVGCSLYAFEKVEAVSPCLRGDISGEEDRPSSPKGRDVVKSNNGS